jgi:hypothetical protein
MDKKSVYFWLHPWFWPEIPFYNRRKSQQEIKKCTKDNFRVLKFVVSKYKRDHNFLTNLCNSLMSENDILL